VLQKVASHFVLQHDALHVQHADDAQREGEHALFVPAATGHVGLRGETPDAAALPGREEEGQGGRGGGVRGQRGAGELRVQPDRRHGAHGNRRRRPLLLVHQGQDQGQVVPLQRRRNQTLRLQPARHGVLWRRNDCKFNLFIPNPGLNCYFL